jgi:chromosome segregation ATPase
VTEKTLSLQLVEMADQVAELERQSSGGADRALGQQDWIAALERISELESQLAFERERYELLAMDYAGADADRKAQPHASDPGDLARIAELEKLLERYKTLNARQEAALGPRTKSIGTVFLDPAATIEKLESRNRELEAAIKHADAIVEQLTHDLDHEVRGSYAATLRITHLTAERDAALDRLQKARGWLSDGHADLITLGGILRHD